MNLSPMLYEMCHNVLSTADIKAICKVRGFSAQAADSRPRFELAFLTETGVAAAMRTLSVAEVVALHLLAQANRDVDITFFERLYGTRQAGMRTYGTFTQQFKPIFDAVQHNLVRKGLLIVAEAKTNALSKTKMELWRFQFPPDFVPYLPPIVNVSIHIDEPGTVHADIFRKKLLHVLQGAPADRQAVTDVHLIAGSLFVAKQPFTVAAVQTWREAAWEEAVLNVALKREAGSIMLEPSVMFQGYMLPTDTYHEPTPLPVIRYTFARLAPDEWIPADELDPILDVLYGSKKHPAGATICQLGWEHGCLARYQANGTVYYRIIDAPSSQADETPDHYLSIADDGIWVDLAKIPYIALEQLNAIATMQVKSGRLLIALSITKMANTRATLHDFAIMRYLKEHSAACRAILKHLDAQWGKLIIHENLLVARITDLSLRVKLQKAFAGDEGSSTARWVDLSDDYVAFPRALIGEVEKLVKKSEHVIKVVQAKS